MKPAVVLGTIALLYISASACFAQDKMKIDWYSINSGGGLAAGSTQVMQCSVGQSAAGFVHNKNHLHWAGFWAGDIPQPIKANTVNLAKNFADGTYVCVAGKIATSAAEDFNGFFYVEEPNRSSGIRVSCPSWPISDLLRGSTVNVIGTLGTTPAGERHITGSIVIVGITTDAPKPIGMNNRAVGGGNVGNPPLGQYGVTGGVGLNNIGLLIKTWGNITGSGSDYLIIDDGSGVGLKIDTSKLASAPTTGYINVTGISSLDTWRLPIVLLRDESDIQ